MGQTRLDRALIAARDTRRLELESGALDLTPRVFRELFGSKPALIITDSTIFNIAGQAVINTFKTVNHACRQPFIYTDPHLYAEHKFVLQLEQALRGHDAIPVAVGAGTINDLAKLAAYRAGRPYMTVATAASMDGYTAFGASITFNGSKQTFSCPAPKAVIADLDVIRAAPTEMSASGYADLLAKITAGADWVLADALEIEPIHQQAWDIVQGDLREAVSNPTGVRNRDPEAIRQLTEGLLLAGFAMQAAQSSRPASGAEHQFSHLWDMQRHTFNGQAPSHGFKVGVGTLAVAGLYEQLLAQPLDQLDIKRCCTEWPELKITENKIRDLLGIGELAGNAIEETRAKQPSPTELKAQLERLRTGWPQLKIRLRAQLLPFREMRQMLCDAGAPNEPRQIGISHERLRRSFAEAAYIRRRFTIFDVALRTGLLEKSLNSLFGPKGPWPTA